MPSSKSLITISFGNIVEWYDFSLFGYFATVIASLYFPTTLALHGLIATYSTFAIGLLARPVGGALFGWIGDNISRNLSLNLSIFSMAIPTFFIGLLPSYQTIGILAPRTIDFTADHARDMCRRPIPWSPHSEH